MNKTKLDAKAIGLRIKQGRKSKSMTQKDLATAIGSWVFTVSRIENGAFDKRPNLTTLGAIAQAIDRPIEWVLYGDDQPTLSGVRTSKDKVFAGFREFMEDSPLSEGISDEEMRALLSIEWPHHKEPTRTVYEKILIDIRSELGTASGLVKKHHAKRGK